MRGRRWESRGFVGVFAALALTFASPLQAKTRVLAFTDSHGLTPFGEALDRWLVALRDAKTADDVQSFALGGSSPAWLLTGATSPRAYVFHPGDGDVPVSRHLLHHARLKTPKLAELLDAGASDYDRQLVLLAFGTNVPGSLASYAASVTDVVRVLRVKPGTLCAWIGPPDMRRRSARWNAQVYDALATAIAAVPSPDGRPACTLVDSRRFSTYPRGGDGAHYPFSRAGTEAVNRWVEGIASEVGPMLAPPDQARADTPEQRAR